MILSGSNFRPEHIFAEKLVTKRSIRRISPVFFLSRGRRLAPTPGPGPSPGPLLPLGAGPGLGLGPLGPGPAPSPRSWLNVIWAPPSPTSRGSHDTTSERFPSFPLFKGRFTGGRIQGNQSPMPFFSEIDGYFHITDVKKYSGRSTRPNGHVRTGPKANSD